MTATAQRERLSASERRAEVLEAACRVFSEGSYRGATTAEIACRAGVSEPILYRHFESKRDLYLACLAEVWERVRSRWETVIETEPDPLEWLPQMGRAFFELRARRALLSNLWVQAVAEASEDPEIRRVVRRHLREVHEFVAGVIRRAQESGRVAADRDPDAEAWVFIAVGLLGAVGRRLGGLVGEDFCRIRAERSRWLAGG